MNGASPAFESFQTIIEQVIGDRFRTKSVSDYIIIWRSFSPEMSERSDNLFQILYHHELYINCKNCIFNIKELKLAGYILPEKAIQADTIV